MLKVIEIFRTRDELDKLVNLPNPRYKSGIRNRAILSVLCYAGLRVSELLNLKVPNISEKENLIKINESKKRSSRVVYVPNYLFHYINKWLDIRPKSKYLFCSNNGNKLFADYIQKMVKRYSLKVDPTKDIHPHCLRHAIATIWLKEGKPIRGIQKQLGHKSLNTTQIYLDYFDDDRKRDFSNSNMNTIRKIEELTKELEKLKTSVKI